jgi:hypothetical protein
MVRNKRRRRIGLIAGYLVTGAIILQLGPLCTLAGSTALGSSIGSLIDTNGRFLGLLNVCGQQDIVYVDAQGVPTDTETPASGSGTVPVVVNNGDDLMYGCPIRYVGPS